jgi:hypothetical protein
VPPIAELSLARFQRYLALLSSIDADAIARSAGADPGICILVWGAGWAADTFHVLVCWSGRGTPPAAPGKPERFSSYSLGDHWTVERDDI